MIEHTFLFPSRSGLCIFKSSVLPFFMDSLQMLNPEFVIVYEKQSLSCQLRNFCVCYFSIELQKFAEFVLDDFRRRIKHAVFRPITYNICNTLLWWKEVTRTSFLTFGTLTTSWLLWIWNWNGKQRQWKTTIIPQFLLLLTAFTYWVDAIFLKARDQHERILCW